MGDVADEYDAGEAPARPRQARRRRKAGGRRNQFLVKADDHEMQRLRKTAAAAGLTVPHLLISTTLAVMDDQRQVPAVDRRTLAWEIETVRASLDAVGRNLNQLARVANATGQVPAELPATLHAVARRMGKVDALLTALGHDPRQHGPRR